MKRSGKNFTFSQEELEALLSTGDAEGLLMKMTGLKKKRAKASDIDDLVDSILGDINNMGRKKVEKPKPAARPSSSDYAPHSTCGYGGGRGCG